MAKKNKSDGGFVYSTNPGYRPEEPDDDAESSATAASSELKVHRLTKNRGGKTVTMVSGFEGNALELAELGKILRNKCGVGGTVKDGEILIQGDLQMKVMEVLKGLGYRVKRGGG